MNTTVTMMQAQGQADEQRVENGALNCVPGEKEDGRRQHQPTSVARLSFV